MLKYMLVGLLIQLLGAAQNPQILAAGLAHCCVAVAGVEIDDPVIAVEPPEKSDFELRIGFGVHNLSDASGDIGLAVGLATLVTNVDFAGTLKHIAHMNVAVTIPL